MESKTGEWEWGSDRGTLYTHENVTVKHENGNIREIRRLNLACKGDGMKKKTEAQITGVSQHGRPTGVYSSRRDTLWARSKVQGGIEGSGRRRG